LAKDKCGLPEPKMQMADMTGDNSNSCDAASGCC